MKKLVTIIIIVGILLYLPSLETSWALDSYIIESNTDFAPPVLPLLQISDFLTLLSQNRSLKPPYRTYNGATVNSSYMINKIAVDVSSFNQLLDPYDNVADPSSGYTWDLKIFHPGSMAETFPLPVSPIPS